MFEKIYSPFKEEEIQGSIVFVEKLRKVTGHFWNWVLEGKQTKLFVLRYYHAIFEMKSITTSSQILNKLLSS